jgi:hypothetical protein
MNIYFASSLHGHFLTQHKLGGGTITTVKSASRNVFSYLLLYKITFLFLNQNPFKVDKNKAI